MIKKYKQWQINESAIVISEELDRLLDRITVSMKVSFDGKSVRCWKLNNGLIDVKGKVDFNAMKNGDYQLYKNMKVLPFKFGIVHWSFKLQSAYIESLVGLPTEIYMDLDIDHCKSITSLEGITPRIGSDFICTGCSSLKTICGFPTEISGEIIVNMGCKSLPEEEKTFINSSSDELLRSLLASGLSLDEFKTKYRGKITGDSYNV